MLYVSHIDKSRGDKSLGLYCKIFIACDFNPLTTNYNISRNRCIFDIANALGSEGINIEVPFLAGQGYVSYSRIFHEGVNIEILFLDQ